MDIRAVIAGAGIAVGLIVQTIVMASLWSSWTAEIEQRVIAVERDALATVGRLERVQVRFEESEQLSSEHGGRIAVLERQDATTGKMLDRIDQRFDSISNRFDTLEALIRAATTQRRSSVGSAAVPWAVQ